MHTIPFVLLSSSTATLIREDGGRKKADSRADIRKSQVFATLFTQGLCTMPSYRSQTRKTSQLTTQRELSRSSLSFVTTLSSLIRPLLLGIVRWSVLISLVKRRDYIREIQPGNDVILPGRSIKFLRIEHLKRRMCQIVELTTFSEDFLKIKYLFVF